MPPSSKYLTQEKTAELSSLLTGVLTKYSDSCTLISVTLVPVGESKEAGDFTQVLSTLQRYVTPW